MIYFTSDLHLCHNRSFLYEPRGFNTIDEMNNAILKNWNNTITEDDDVYVLGDLMLNDNTSAIGYLKQLRGRIHIVTGNHDTDTRIDLYKSCWNIVELCGYSTVLKYNGYHFYLSHYPTLCSNYDIDKPLKRRVINLAGHVHTDDKWYDWDKGLIYHVELDAHNNTPVSIDTIISDIQKKIGE